MSIMACWVSIGGNSSDFILQLCRHNATLHRTVLDLPMAREIGIEHVLRLNTAYVNKYGWHADVLVPLATER
ncbi:MAG TPA: hypothetical protein VJX94_28545 [Stellaceae bacterium]|nr:hypothetical protein [Stellaceae bacterium]